MKTPMQELMQELKKELKIKINIYQSSGEIHTLGEVDGLGLAWEMAESMLEKEKEAIIDFAYKFGDEPLAEIAKWYDKQFNK